ncbi:hypothetical protein K435DRAFT_695448, partial [Dendrothele bispora CBS 962.96]
VFFLYTDLQSHPQSQQDATFRGLGHVDSHKDVLVVTLELTKPPEPDNVEVHHEKSGRSRKKRPSSHKRDLMGMDIEVQIAQDKTALRSRKGDTGSVVWKASVDFGHLILQNVHFPTHNICPLFDYAKLKKSHVLELGYISILSGTGLLSVLLSPLVQKYTATDIEDLIPLIQKNLDLNLSANSNVNAAPLDWLVIQKTTSKMRSQHFSFDSIDLLLIVDCIYHPSLLPALLETIDYLAIPGLTTVLVVVELRADDVIREFLDRWLKMACWTIWRVGGGDGCLMGRPYVLWVGVKRSQVYV